LSEDDVGATNFRDCRRSNGNEDDFAFLYNIIETVHQTVFFFFWLIFRTFALDNSGTR
jgi:hypothetical protein